jgi:hypothetical protein
MGSVESRLTAAPGAGGQMEKDAPRHATSARTEKKPWETPKLSYVGDVEDVVQQGEGKMTRASADPGEDRKTRPSG